MSKKFVLTLAVTYSLSLLFILTSWGHDSPEGTDSGSAHNIKIYTDIDQPTVLADQRQELVVKVGISVFEELENKSRLPLNIAIVLDKSGSMDSQDKLENAKRGAIEIIDRLNQRDIVSLVAYDSVVRVLIPAQPVQSKENLIDIIQSIHASGSTALYDGVLMGAAELEEYASEDYISRIILLSDGLANVGPSSTEAVVAYASKLNIQEISVTTIGVGLDYNEDLMYALAVETGGYNYFAHNSDQLPGIFAEEIGRTMTILAKDITMALECLNGSQPLGTIGPHGKVSRRSIKARYPFLYNKDDRYVLFEMQIPPQPDDTTLDIAHITITYKDPATQKLWSEERTIRIDFNANASAVMAAQNKLMLKDTSLRRNAVVRELAVQLSKDGRYRQAVNLLNESTRDLEKTGRICDNDRDILNAAQTNRRLSDQLERNKGYSPYENKYQIMEAHQEFWG